MRLPRLEKGIGYIGASLFLPRDKIVEKPIKNALTFEIGSSEYEMFRVHPFHLEVPRNFFSAEQLKKLDIDIVDIRPQTFAKSSLAPKSTTLLRENQADAWNALLSAAADRRDGVLRLDTGKGKTVMGLYYAAHVGGPVLVVSAQEAHLKNWEKEIETLFTLAGGVGWIAGNKFEYEKDVVFSTVQTLVRRAEEGKLPHDFHTRFALVIYDEVHHQAASWFAKSSDLFTGQRLGLTATLKRKDRCENMVLFHIGPVLYDDPSEDTLVPTVHVHTSAVSAADDDPRIIDVLREPNVAKLRRFLSEDTGRNQQLVGIIQKRLKEGHKVYVLTHVRDHVAHLQQLLADVGILAGVITGAETSAIRRLEQLNNYDVVVATLHVGKENYNRPILSALLLATPLPADNYAPTEWVQAVGRILRPFPGKPPPVVDLVADPNVTMSAALTSSTIKWCKERKWTLVGDDVWKKRESRITKAWRVK